MSSEEKKRFTFREIFSNRDFRHYQLARFTGILGAQMIGVAVAWQVFQATHRPLDLGLVGLAQFIPGFGLTLLTGAAADKYDRKRILALCYAVMTLATIALALIAYSKTSSVKPVYAVLIALGTARAFGGPAGQALAPTLVPTEQFATAIAWTSSTWQVATIIGPAVGGAALTWGGPIPVYSASILLLLIAVFSMLTMKMPHTPRPKTERTPSAMWATLLVGVRYVWSTKPLLGAISLDLFAVLLGGASALLPMFSDILNGGPWGYGLLRSAPGVGAAATAIWMANRPIQRHAGVKMFVAVFIFGLATIAFGYSRNLILSIAALALTGVVDMISVVVRQTFVQLKTPDEMRGRVSAVNMVFIGASNELGEFESGVTAAWLGAVRAVILGGVGTCVVVMAWAAMFPELRKVDRLHE